VLRQCLAAEERALSRLATTSPTPCAHRWPLHGRGDPSADRHTHQGLPARRSHHEAADPGHRQRR
jgi:hypothetical protein